MRRKRSSQAPHKHQHSVTRVWGNSNKKCYKHLTTNSQKLQTSVSSVWADALEASPASITQLSSSCHRSSKPVSYRYHTSEKCTAEMSHISPAGSAQVLNGCRTNVAQLSRVCHTCLTTTMLRKRETSVTLVLNRCHTSATGIIQKWDTRVRQVSSNCHASVTNSQGLLDR